MSVPIISVRNLGKSYRLGAALSHDTLRDQLTHSFKSLARAFRGGNGTGSDNPNDPQEFWALKDVSFDVFPGDVVGVVGRNGAGKSTLLKILSQITEPSTGEICIKGKMASLLEVGTGFHPELTGRENIFLNGAILGMTKAEIKKKFDEIVDFAEVEKFLDTPVKRYSSGMYVRLAVAVAAHLEPDILLVDEVLAVGDASFQNKCMTKMDNVATQQGRTVLFVSHNMAAVQRLCTKGIFIEAGRLREHGPIARVLDLYQRSFDRSETDPAQMGELKSGQARFVSWELAHSTTGCQHSCFTREECEFVITLASRIQLDDAGISFMLLNAEGDLVVSANSVINRMPRFKIPEGVHQIRVKVRLPIKAGVYQSAIRLNRLSKGQVEGCCLEPKLHVLPSGTHQAEKWQGLVTEEVQFQTSFL